jgi:hypothetical protein
LPEHVVEPGTHIPEHDPPLQTYGQPEPLFCHAPDTQLWG